MKVKQYWLAILSLCAASMFSVAAHAQTAVTNTACGTNPRCLRATVPAQAAATNAVSSLPQAMQQGNVTFLTGGVGSDESQAMRAAARHWPLSLLFTSGKNGAYLADVHVTIDQLASHGKTRKGAKHGANISGQKTVLEADARGPFMLVRLHPGTYRVTANYQGHELSRTVTLNHRHRNIDFSWPQSTSQENS